MACMINHTVLWGYAIDACLHFHADWWKRPLVSVIVMLLSLLSCCCLSSSSSSSSLLLLLLLLLLLPRCCCAIKAVVVKMREWMQNGWAIWVKMMYVCAWIVWLCFVSLTLCLILYFGACIDRQSELLPLTFRAYMLIKVSNVWSYTFLTINDYKPNNIL